MSAYQDVEFHAGETWLVRFVCHDAAGAIFPLPIGTLVKFRLSDLQSTILTASTDDGSIVITDGDGGAGEAKITPEMQDAAGIEEKITYRYELRVETPTLVSVQAIGKFKILRSLFVT